jgi:hypothetical protein
VAKRDGSAGTAEKDGILLMGKPEKTEEKRPHLNLNPKDQKKVEQKAAIDQQIKDSSSNIQPLSSKGGTTGKIVTYKFHAQKGKYEIVDKDGVTRMPKTKAELDAIVKEL